MSVWQPVAAVERQSPRGEPIRSDSRSSVSSARFADCVSLCQPTPPSTARPSEREAALTALGFSRQAPARTKRKAEHYLVCVSVVVVVTGAGTVVCSDVVVVLCVVSEAQPDMNARATMVRQEMIIFFIRRD